MEGGGGGSRTPFRELSQPLKWRQRAYELFEMKT